MNLKKSLVLALLIIIIDQVSKIYIKTNFVLNEEIYVFKWFRIHFVENEGMAFGATLPSDYGKIILTLFRIVAVGAILFWLWNSIKKRVSTVIVLAITFILAGAIGNILDSVFYGVIFTDSHAQLATAFGEKPYGTWFHGKVVDMFYFPIWKGNLPQWLPFYGGNEFTFFNAIFNFADAAISVGVILLLLFNKRMAK